MTVEGYCGLFGSGKTYAAVMETYKRRQRDPHLPVMTNLTKLNLPGDPVEYCWGYDDPEEMLAAMARFEGGVMLLDEVGVFLPARVWNRMPPQLSWKWNQLRKERIDLLWTCIRPANVVKDLRDITMETHWCESWQGVGKLIPGMGFFTQSTYSYTAVGDKKYFQSKAFRRFRPELASQLYDTMGKVQQPKFLQKREKPGVPESSQP